MAITEVAEKENSTKTHSVKELDEVTIRFAGDSGDGMQLTGTRFSYTSALIGNDIGVFPDYPAEIRAPAGTLPGVSGFQVHFSKHDIRTPGDRPFVLVAMNPASLKVNIADLVDDGILVVNRDVFVKYNLDKAGYKTNPLEDGSLNKYKVVEIPITTLTLNALEKLELPKRDAERCKNFFALGVTYWMFERPLNNTEEWIRVKFKNKPSIMEANLISLKAGYDYADTAELMPVHYRVVKAKQKPGIYKAVTGNEAAALGFIAASLKAGKKLFYGSYPITPASDILHTLAKYKEYGVRTFQAEDEIAAVGAALGAAYAGDIALTGTSGPGLALKSEFIGLGVMTEMPMVIVNVQRGGPSTGLPTKTEQADLFQALFGRNGECPVPIIAPATSTECFSIAFEAVRIAVTYMVPVLYLSDGYLGNGTEPWRIPDEKTLSEIIIQHPTDPDNFLPYGRDPRTLARPWTLPGTKGLQYRIGGLEKQDGTGNVSYDPDNHHRMTQIRAEKVNRIQQDIPPTEISGSPEGDLLILGWGSTHGAITSAVEREQIKGVKVSSVHLRYLNPLPPDLKDILSRFKKILVAELNMGQLLTIIRAKYLIDAEGLNKVKGKPFMINEIQEAIQGYK